MRSAKDAFLVKEWLAADGDERNAADASLADGVSCDEAGCVVEIAGGGFIAQSQRAEAIEEDCERAALVVTARQPPKDCGTSLIDQPRLRRQGSLALWRTKDGFVVEAGKPRGFDRPWSPALTEGNETDTATISRPSTARARDATPSDADLQADE
jgi:competence protein ComEC